jgi:hypothetical protein
MGSSQLWVTPVTNSSFPADEPRTWLFDLSTLQSEKEILENGLANCLTYLQVLRKKQARTERRLGTDVSLPRKKRKKLQQVKHELDKEIRHRERDEQAFLNNLQACKANIYIAETASLPSTAISSTLPDFASVSTGYSYPRDLESAPTETSWNGWTDETALSPFQQESNNPFLVFDFGPDEHVEVKSVDGMIQDDCKQPLDVPRIGNTHAIPCVSSNTPTRLQLSPEAPVFQPRFTRTRHEETQNTQLADLALSSSLMIMALDMEELQLLDRRLVSDAGMSQARRQSWQNTLGEMGMGEDSQNLAKSSADRAPAGRRLKRRTSSL